ncbi:MAG: cation transporter [Paramuribaculum sp.]|nr:cation transporter [Paramuribaculum sp.]
MEETAERRKKALYRVTWYGSLLNMLLFAFKLIAGILGRSSAMIADAVHSLSDFVTDIIVIVFVKISSKPADKLYEYGHGKYETLATLIISFMLLLAGLGIAADGIGKIIRWLKGEELERPGYIALIAAVVSIVLKEGMYRYTYKVGKFYNSPVVIANAWHHRSDAWSSLGTLLGIGGAILLGAHWRVLDPLAAVIVSFFIIYVSVEMIRPATAELLERSLPLEVQAEINKTVMQNPAVYSIHNLRTRRIGNRVAIEFHIRMEGSQSLTEAHYHTMEIERELKKKFGDETHIAIHMEPLLNEYSHEKISSEKQKG